MRREGERARERGQHWHQSRNIRESQRCGMPVGPPRHLGHGEKGRRASESESQCSLSSGFSQPKRCCLFPLLCLIGFWDHPIVEPSSQRRLCPPGHPVIMAIPLPSSWGDARTASPIYGTATARLIRSKAGGGGASPSPGTASEPSRAGRCLQRVLQTRPAEWLMRCQTTARKGWSLQHRGRA